MGFHVQAEQTIHDRAAVEAVLKEAGELSEHHPPLREVLDPLHRLVRAYVSGAYPQADEDDVAWALAAVMYVASPWDLTPDYLPGGLYDDIRVNTWVAERIWETLAHFDEWDRLRVKRERATSFFTPPS
jgi:uncharacterized membrane protein YkvA (DUF1232 family)